MKPKTDNTKLIASYFAAAFGVLQIVDIVIDRLDFPEHGSPVNHIIELLFSNIYEEKHAIKMPSSIDKKRNIPRGILSNWTMWKSTRIGTSL